ncbi:MAG TPA: methylmalonyl Co-A mutase-associated GTPase MeaB [Candidatus Deferrimicrobium sp.]|nr:methylmalonyl Co-A mutase-associated GTPase MeaB [Candidatus Deferrimicrobium sp.]
MTAAGREILAGNTRAAARLMRDLDDEMPTAIRTLKELYRHTGRAYILGVTGAPGAGKSTLVNRITTHLRKNGKSVGIVAIDPTSPFSGGAILGDRIRMQQHALDEGVFIKSLATRGHLGGLSRSTIDIVNVMDAMGKDVILIETVGVGQDEVEIVKVAHTNLVLVVPGLGDDIQAIKAGILEIADIFVINKADRDGADKARREIETMVSMTSFKEGDWKPPVLSTVAATDKGTEELLEAVWRHQEYIYQEGNLSRYRREKARVELVEILKTRLIEKAVADLDENGLLEPLLTAMAKKRKDPYSISEKVVDHSFAFHLMNGGRSASKAGKGKRR